jgi:hypothetical protein
MRLSKYSHKVTPGGASLEDNRLQKQKNGGSSLIDINLGGISNIHTFVIPPDCCPIPDD